MSVPAMRVSNSCPDGQYFDITANVCMDCEIGSYSNTNTGGKCQYCKYSFYPGAASCQEGFVTIIAGVEVSPDESGELTDADFTYSNGYGPIIRLNNPRAITNDRKGNVYFTESQSVVRKLSMVDYSVTTITKHLTPDGACALDGIAIDPTDVYIYVSSCRQIRRVALKTGAVTILADKLPDQELFGGSISLSASGKYLYRATGSPTIRQVDTISPYQAASLLLPTSDTELDAESRTFSLAISSTSEYLYEVGYNGVVNRLDPKGAFVTIAGSFNDKAEEAVDGQGTAAFMPSTASIVMDATDNMLVTDPGGLYIHKVSSSGLVGTLVDMIKYFNASMFLGSNATDSSFGLFRRRNLASRNRGFHTLNARYSSLRLDGGIDDPRVRGPGKGGSIGGGNGGDGGGDGDGDDASDPSDSTDDGGDSVDADLLVQVSPWGISADRDGRVYFTTGGVCGSVRMLHTGCPANQYGIWIDSQIVCQNIPAGICD